MKEGGMRSNAEFNVLWCSLACRQAGQEGCLLHSIPAWKSRPSSSVRRHKGKDMDALSHS
eukprot:761684-Hanusia_phi.AAC.10